MYGKSGFMTIKLDMSKTYDRVGWDFLEEVYEEDRVRGKMDKSYYDVCLHDPFFCPSEWDPNGPDHAYSGY
jgi:hypothetical protein